MNRTVLLILVLPILIHFRIAAQTGQIQGPTHAYDISKDPVLYTVGYAHLDTEWRWDYQETIEKYLKATLDDNFMRFEKYPSYVFTFSGARRYRMMKEYYPERYEKLKKYIARNKWFVGGSSVEECDANVPSPESLLRQVLYGNNYFRNEFGKESVDFMLPDCFGFQAHLPSVLAHAGLKGFSTQKLAWGSAVGIPFNIGNWNGPNGKGITAALNATDYTGKIKPGIDTSAYWVERVMDNGRKYGVFADYRYYGVGDIGGAPREDDIRNAIASTGNPERKINIYLCSSDQLFRDLTSEQLQRLPSYTGDLLLTEHSAGSLTSQAYMKRWNRKNELLAQATEPLAVMADWLGGMKYPKEMIQQAWWLTLGSQMHDILPGTCLPKAYEYAWNDEVLAMNLFSSALTHAAGVVIRAMDTQSKGKSIVVINPLSIPRTDLASAEVSFPEGIPKGVLIIGPDGKEIPSQITGITRNTIHLLFIATVPSFGLACYDVQPTDNPTIYKSNLIVQQNTMENENLKVTINKDGDIAGIINKKTLKEVLSAPSRLVFQKEHPEYWPAWNMDWKDRKKPPADSVSAPARITITERGPIRATFCVERTKGNSTFTQYIRLVAGGESVIIGNNIQWQTSGVSLKAAFPLIASNPVATYNLGLGTIERANNDSNKYEVPSREWFDLTDKSGNFGVTILEDGKFGSDKPTDKAIRLTLLYTPKSNFYHDQATQDWGTHTFTYGIYPHKGDWRTGGSEWQARSLNQPFITFQTIPHPGFLGKTFSFVRITTQQVELQTVKKAEAGNTYIIRLRELWGRETELFDVTFASKIISAWEVDGQERNISDFPVTNGILRIQLGKYDMRTFSVSLAPPAQSLTEITSVELPLVYDQDVVSSDIKRSDGLFDDQHWSYPAELFPEKLNFGGITFKMGNKAVGQSNVLACSGQKIPLPKTGNFNKLYILAAAVTDTSGVFKTGIGKSVLRIQKFNGMIGQYDNRIWDRLGRITGLEPGYIKRDKVAWFATHMHRDTTTLPYQYGYMFLYSVEAGAASGYLQLPDNPLIRIFAITAAFNPFDAVESSSPLYDDFTGRPPMSLNLPRSFTSESVPQLINITTFRKAHLGDLPCRITMKDYADLHQPNGVLTRFYYTVPDTAFAGFPDETNLPTLTDGMFILLESDSVNDWWSEQGEGRIWMDFQRDIELDSIHLFAVVSPSRGPISFSVWAASGSKSPDPKGDVHAAGWKYLGYIAPVNIWGNGYVLYTLRPEKGVTLRNRYLMLLTEPTGAGFGPYYFREIDVFERQK
jgi:alpha-mannosidase